jgi:four helix bundle protein
LGGLQVADIRSHRDLIAWQKGMDLIEQVYQVTRRFPQDERFGLVSQIRRAAVSIPSNIAEGFGRRTKQDYMRFLDMARGSANELDTQLQIAERLQFMPKQQAGDLLTALDEIQRVLYGLMQAVQNNHKGRYDQ